jgi:hypothetical protein
MSEHAFESCATTCDKVKAIYKWTPEEKKGFRLLAKWCLANWPSLHHAFVNTSRTLAAKGEEIGYDWTKLLDFERKLAAICMTGDMPKAAVEMADELVYNVDTYLKGSDDPDYQKLVTELSGFRSRLSATESAQSL